MNTGTLSDLFFFKLYPQHRNDGTWYMCSLNISQMNKTMNEEVSVPPPYLNDSVTLHAFLFDPPHNGAFESHFNFSGLWL